MVDMAWNDWSIFTGKSVSEALILDSVNPQYDERLFIEFPEKYKFRTNCVQILFRMLKQTQKTIFVHNMFWTYILYRPRYKTYYGGYHGGYYGGYHGGHYKKSYYKRNRYGRSVTDDQNADREFSDIQEGDLHVSRSTKYRDG